MTELEAYRIVFELHPELLAAILGVGIFGASLLVITILVMLGYGSGSDMGA